MYEHNANGQWPFASSISCSPEDNRAEQTGFMTVFLIRVRLMLCSILVKQSQGADNVLFGLLETTHTSGSQKCGPVTLIVP